MLEIFSRDRQAEVEGDDITVVVAAVRKKETTRWRIRRHITKDNYPCSDKEHNPTIAIIELISSYKPTEYLTSKEDRATATIPTATSW